MASDLIQKIKLSISVLGAKNAAAALSKIADNTKKLHKDTKILQEPLDKVNLKMLALQNTLKKQGKDWKSLGISMELGRKALGGNALAINTVNQQLVKLNKTTLLSVRNTRNLHGSFSVFRSKLLLVTFGIAMVDRAVLRLVKSFAEQEAVNQKLAAGLANVADTTPGVTQRLIDYSSALQQTSVFGDELITNGMAQLTTFTLNEEAIKALTPQVLNVARAIQTTSGHMPDLNSLFIAFGKSTSTAVSALTRYGVVLTDTEKTQLESMGANERAGAIAEILEKQYGGLNEAYKKTTAGMLEAANLARGDAAEAFGSILAPSVLKVSNALKSFFEAMTPGKIRRFGSAVGIAALAFGVLNGNIWKAVKALKAFAIAQVKTGWGAIATAIGLAAFWAMEYFGVFEDGTETVSDHEKRVKEQMKAIKALTEEQAESIVSLQDRHKLLHNTIAQENALTSAEVDRLKIEAEIIKLGHKVTKAERDIIKEIVEHQRTLENLKQSKRDQIKLDKEAEREKKRLLGLLEATDAGQRKKLTADLDSLRAMKDSKKATEEWIEAEQELLDKLKKLDTVEVKLTDIQKEAKKAIEGTVSARETQIKAVIAELELQKELIKAQKSADWAAQYILRSEAIKNLKEDLEDLNKAEDRNIEILETLGIAKEHGIKIDEGLRQKIVEKLQAERQALKAQLELTLGADEYVKALERLLEVETALGLADDPWEKRLDMMNQVNEGMGALSTTAGMYFSLLQEGWSREMSDMKESDKYKLASSQRQKRMEKEVQDRQRSGKQTAWKQEQALNISAIIMKTATAVMDAFSKGNPLLAAFMGTMGALQLGIVSSQTMPKFARGGDFIVPPGYPNDTFPMRVESGERVQITPKTEVGGAMTSQSTVNINFTGNVLSQDFIEDEAIPMIKEAVRRGADIGVA